MTNDERSEHPGESPEPADPHSGHGEAAMSHEEMSSRNHPRRGPKARQETRAKARHYPQIPTLGMAQAP